MLEVEKILKHGAMDKLKIPCDIGDIVPFEEDLMEPLVYKSMNQLHKGEKRFMVKQVWGNNAGSLGSTAKGQMLEDEDLQLTFEYLQWQYQSPEVSMISPNVVKVAAVEGFSEPGGRHAILEMQEAMQIFKYVVLPIHADTPLHWTAVLLVMHSDAEEEEVDNGGVKKVKEIFYFDWCESMKWNEAYARKVVRLLTLEKDQFLKLPVKKNKFRQAAGSNDCGLVVWYALEVALKASRKEGMWMVYPSPAAWRQKLHTMKSNLYEEKASWTLEVGQKLKPKFFISKPGEKILDKSAVAKLITSHWKAGSLKHKPAEFFTCGRCRWSSSGEGCFGCNPAKAAAVKADREKQCKQLEHALAAALEICKKKNLIEAEDPPDKPLEAMKLLGGNGGEQRIDTIYFYIYIYM